MHRLMESENMPTLQFAQEAQNPPMKLIQRPLDTAASTNDEGSAWIKTAAPGQALSVWTSHQTAGRGQRGNEWNQARGLDLAWTFAYKWPQAQNPWNPIAFNKAVAAELCTAIRQHLPSPDATCGLKWPNDILLRFDHRPWEKCAGLLIENSWKGDRWDGVCVGLGVNVNSNRTKEARRCSLRDLTGQPHDLAALVNTLCSSVIRVLEAGENEPAYNELLIGLGRTLRFHHRGTAGLGTVQGVDTNGSLMLDWRAENGSTERLSIEHSGELEWDGIWVGD